MTDKEIDKTLAKRFSQMRSDEMANIPEFPNEYELRSREAIGVKNTSYAALVNSLVDYLPKIAAGFVLIVITSFFATNKPEEDLTVIYAEIMKNHESMITDNLLVVSESILPSTAGIPGLYDLTPYSDLQFEPIRVHMHDVSTA